MLHMLKMYDELGAKTDDFPRSSPEAGNLGLAFAGSGEPTDRDRRQSCRRTLGGGRPDFHARSGASAGSAFGQGDRSPPPTTIGASICSAALPARGAAVGCSGHAASLCSSRAISFGRPDCRPQYRCQFGGLGAGRGARTRSSPEALTAVVDCQAESAFGDVSPLHDRAQPHPP